MTWLSKILAAIATKVGTILAVVAVVVLIVQVAYCRAKDADAGKRAAELALTKAQIAALVHELGAVQGTVNTERSMNANLSARLAGFVSKVKKIDPKARVDAIHETKITIKDTAPGVVAETYVEDSHHRFRFDLPSGLLHRSQSFKLTVLSIRGIDGAYRIAQNEFREYDPITGEEIPSEGVSTEGTFEFGEEHIVYSPWHTRIVAGVGIPFGVGAGLQINPWKWLTAGAVLLYQPTDKIGVGALTLGYRLFNSTVSVGPFGGINTKGALTGGVLATIEVTR